MAQDAEQGPPPSSTASAAALARLLLSGGRAADALGCVDAVLAAAPRSVDLLHLRGSCLLAAGNVPGAYTSLMAALAAEPSHLPALLDLAALYSGRGLQAEARDVLERAAAAHPGDARVAEALATVLTDLGTAAKCGGRVDDAVALYSAAVTTWPALAAAHYNLGVVASEAGRARWPEALEHYARAVAANPGYAQAHCNTGVIHREEGRLEEAVAAYEKAFAAAPSHELVRTGLAAALTDLGTTTKARGDAAGGIVLYERALAVAPRHADAAYNLAVALAEPGPAHAPDRALFLYHTATGMRPDCAEAWNNAGVLHRERGELERAAECYLAALNIRPNFLQALNNLGVLYTSQGRAGEAIALLQAAVAAAPLYAEAWNNLGVAQRDIGDVVASIASYERAAALAPEQPNAAQNRLLALNYARPGEDRWVCAEHASWGRDFAARFQRLPPVRAGDRTLTAPAAVGAAPRRLRVGYISPDLFTHSVSYFAEAPLSHHNAAAVEVFVYDCTPRRDAKSQRLRQLAEAAGATWRCVESLSDDALAAAVRGDAVDVLVELTGHTAHNRLGVMARRPAPVQVTWIGYPNSTGLAEVDYRLTDATCDPLDTKQTFVESLVRLPGCFLCYTPPLDAPPVAPPPAAGRGFVTFGSFNALAKVTDDTLALWARVLASVPGSRLVLKNKPFACPQARALWMGRLAALGVDAWRVDLLPLAPSNAEHLAQYALLDVALDPTPYAGTTTTAEALFMGVPVITLRGGCHAANVSASLLAAVGLAGGWVAEDADAFVARAVEAAADIPRLAALRAGMRERVLGSPLCEARPFVARLEGVYARLFQDWLDAGTAAEAAGLGQQGGGGPEDAAEESLDVLEWRDVCRQVACFCTTPMAAEAALAGLRLGASQEESELLLQQTEEASAATMQIEGVLDLRPAIEAAAAGSVLNAKQLEGVAASLEAALQLRAAACQPATAACQPATAAPGAPEVQGQQEARGSAVVQGPRFPALARLAEAIPAEEAATVAALRSCIRGGSVTDMADAALASTRAERAANLAALRELVTATARDLAARNAAESREPLLVRGRFCVAVRSNRRSELPKGSIKLGASASGATVYMEPAPAVEMNNRETELAARERELEVQVLARLSAALGRRGRQLAALLAAVTQLDLAAARAAHAAWLGGVPPQFVSRASADAGAASPLHAPGVLHPLLLEAALPPLPRPPTADDRPFAADFSAVPTFGAQPLAGAGLHTGRERAVRPHPLDLRVPPAKSVVTITGPNTGGKTVTLKVAGLVALMAKAGLFLAVEAGSPPPRLWWFSSVLADIGDSQSLQQSLSTFSGHVRRLRRVLAAAGPSSLVLLDEVGSGTDPGEGAALARAVLDALAPRGGLTLATSHHAELKALPSEDARFANAAMGFDTASLAPTYELTWGAAGASNALDIAARLGFDGAVVADARALAASEEAARAAAAADMARVAASIEAQLAETRARLERRRLHRAEAEERLAGLRTTEHSLSKLRGTVVRAPGLVRQVVSREVLQLQLALAEFRRGTIDAAALSQRLEKVEAALPPHLRPGSEGGTGGAAGNGPALSVGDRVTVPKLGVFGEGTVVKVAGGTVTVDVKLPGLGRPRGGSKPIKVAVDEVVRQDEARAAAAAAGAASAAAGREGGRGGAYAALLGRVDEALAALEAGDRER